MSARLPLVSVIIPAYQAAATLNRALESVLQQDYPALEVVVVDDGSTDATFQTAAAAAARDARVHAYRQANQGPAAARNTAEKQAHGEYLTFLDADDEWYPGKVQAQVAVLNQCPDIGLVFTDAVHLDANTGRAQQISERHAAAMRKLHMTPLACQPAALAVSEAGLRHTIFEGGVVFLGSVMLRRELFARLHGFDVSLHGTDDVDFTLRAARLARFAYCREVLAAHHISGHNMSSPSAVWYQEIIRYTRLILASPADADLHAPARQFLRQMYRQLIFFHGRHRQPRLAWATLRASRDSGLDGLSLLCALGAWLGPLPFMAMGRLLWSQA